MEKPTIILEAVASNDLWIWHAFFRISGSHNDINVLHRSPLFAKLAKGRAPEMNSSWATFESPPLSPWRTRRNILPKQRKQQGRMSKELLGFSNLARFTIVRGEACLWDIETLGNIMKACVVMLNIYDCSLCLIP